MTFDAFGTRKEKSHFNNFVDFISEQPHDNWEYYGMSVELDPTVDFVNETIKFRWLDLNEGFNDKIILKTKEDFFTTFKKVS